MNLRGHKWGRADLAKLKKLAKGKPPLMFNGIVQDAITNDPRLIALMKGQPISLHPGRYRTADQVLKNKPEGLTQVYPGSSSGLVDSGAVAVHQKRRSDSAYYNLVTKALDEMAKVLTDVPGMRWKKHPKLRDLYVRAISQTQKRAKR